jgi:hypothetical protein
MNCHFWLTFNCVTIIHHVSPSILEKVDLEQFRKMSLCRRNVHDKRCVILMSERIDPFCFVLRVKFTSIFDEGFPDLCLKTANPFPLTVVPPAPFKFCLQLAPVSVHFPARKMRISYDGRLVVTFIPHRSVYSLIGNHIARRKTNHD